MVGDPDDVNDEIWRPNYQGPAPLSLPIRLPPATEPGPPRPPAHERRSPDLAELRTVPETDLVPRQFDPGPGSGVNGRWRWPSVRTVVGIIAVGAISIAGGVMATDSGGEPADPTSAPAVTVDDVVGPPTVERYELPDVAATNGAPFAGADPKRLPDTLDPIWSRLVPATESDDAWVEVIDRRFALVATGHDQTLLTGSSVLQSLDAETGVTRWSTSFAVPPRSVAFVATNANSVALLVDGTLTGIDSATGEAMWDFESVRALFESDVERLDGTDLLAIGSPDGTSTLVDMATGDTVGRLEGPTITTDHLGRWYVRRGDDIVRYDLGDGFREPTAVALGFPDPVVSVVGRDVLASGPEGWTASIASDERIGSERAVLEVADEFPTAAAILPMLGTTFLVAGAGAIVGADLDGQEVRFAWKRNGTVTAMYPTERGFLVHAASQGGADQTIFDGRNGNAVVTLTMTPGLFDSLVVTGNGILTKTTSSDGPRLAGLDLDGDEMWSIRDVTAASVGDRLIVTTTRLHDGSIRLDAIGEPSTP